MRSNRAVRVVEVYRDMNWYASDGGSPLAPDLLVLPAGVVVAASGADPSERVKSYRQDKTGGPAPSVVVEVPLGRDSYAGLRSKAHRCRSLGAVVYIVMVDHPYTVERLAPPSDESGDWTGRPISELGGICVEFTEAGSPVVVLPDGTRAVSDLELLAQEQGRHRAALRRVEELERRLSEAGLDTDP